MADMLAHLLLGLQAFVQDEFKVALVGISLAASFLVLFLAKRGGPSARRQSIFMHLHLAFLLFPFVLLAISLTCQQAGLCAVGVTQLALLSIPLAVAAALFAGLVLIPLAHRLRGKLERGWMQSFIQVHGGGADVFLFGSSRKTAYSVAGLKPAIFVSSAMNAALSRKQLQAVLLHELAHIRRGSQPLKTVALFLAKFSPLRALVAIPAIVRQEEAFADGFARKVQGTNRHLENARRRAG